MIPQSLKFVTKPEGIVTSWKTFYGFKQESSSGFEDILQSIKKTINDVEMSQEFCRLIGRLPLRESYWEYGKTGKISHPR